MTCTIIYDAVRSDETVILRMLSPRGRRREVTGLLIERGYRPLAPWWPDGSERVIRRFGIGREGNHGLTVVLRQEASHESA